MKQSYTIATVRKVTVTSCSTVVKSKEVVLVALSAVKCEGFALHCVLVVVPSLRWCCFIRVVSSNVGQTLARRKVCRASGAALVLIWHQSQMTPVILPTRIRAECARYWSIG